MTGDSATEALSSELLKVARLEQDEKVEWVGRPEAHAAVQWKLYRKTMLYATVMAVVLSYQTILGLVTSPLNPLAWGVTLFCLSGPSLLIAMIGKFQEITASDTIYAITNKRALIFVGRRMREFKSVYYLDTVERSDGFRDLVMDRLSSSQQSTSDRTRIGFIGLTEQDAEVAQPLLVGALNPPLVRTLTPQQDLQIFQGPS